MVEETRKTWVQANISPFATRLLAVAFLNRKAISWGIHAVAQTLSEPQKISFRMALNKHRIILPQYFDLPLEELKHFQLSKGVTVKRLLLAAGDIYKSTGRDIFLKIVPEIVKGRVSGTIEFNPSGVDYRQVLSTASILRKIRTGSVEEEPWATEVINQAFDLAARYPGVSKKDLIYRLGKMADVGGDIQAIIASLFINVPADKLPELYRGVQGGRLLEFGDPILKIIRRFQHLRDHFDFDARALTKDEKCLFRKMSELVRRARSPQVLLLFFLHKLIEARAARDFSNPIFDQIRFLYAPLTERLGLVYLAEDFRDQFLRLSNSEKYAFIEQKVYQRIDMNYDGAKIFLSIYVREMLDFLQRRLGTEYRGIVAKFRVKSPYSIWNKVEVRCEYSYDEIKDILGIKLIFDSEQIMLKFRDALVKKNELFLVDPKGVKEVLVASGEAGWRGIKLEGKDSYGTPIEIQLMTQEMNQENNCGRAATWLYNLQKELGETKQVFDLLEPKEVRTPNFVENFYQLLNFWTVPIPFEGTEE